MSLNLAQKCPASTTWEGEGRVGRRKGKGDKREGEKELEKGEGTEKKRKGLTYSTDT